MISFNGPTWSYITPDDGDLGQVIAEFISLVPDRSSLRVMIYGWTDPQVFQSLIDVEAQNRGVDSRGLCDHTQSIGPVEARNLGAFFNTIKRFDSNGSANWVVGTSDKNDQIIHAKTVWANWSENSVAPSGPMPMWSDWRGYVKSGWPTVLRGSYNWSTSAHQQVNTMDISPSVELCGLYQTTYNRVRAYNLQKNKQWNTAVVHPTILSPEYQKLIPDDGVATDE